MVSKEEQGKTWGCPMMKWADDGLKQQPATGEGKSRYRILSGGTGVGVGGVLALGRWLDS